MVKWKETLKLNEQYFIEKSILCDILPTVEWSGGYTRQIEVYLGV